MFDLGNVSNPKHHSMIERYFRYEHLPEGLRVYSKPLCDLAYHMALLCENSKDPDEVTKGLNAMLEAKDCFVRAMLP